MKAITSNAAKDTPDAPLEPDFNARLIDSSHDCIKVLDLDARLVSMNAGGMELLEICDFGPLQGASWLDFWEGDDRIAAQKAVEIARGGGVGRFTGFFHTMQTRRPLWFDVVVNPILGVSGKPERLLASSRDVTESKRAQELLRAIIEGTAGVTGREFFRSLVKHLAEGLRVRFAFVAECLPDLRARSLAYWADHKFGRDFEYSLPGTPCMEVVQGRVCHVPDRLAEVFPQDRGMIALGGVSYLGVPLLNGARQTIGHLIIFDDKPMPADPLALRVMETFAARAGAELEREQAQQKLEAALDEVQRLKERLHAENIYLQEEIRSEHNFTEIVGRSPKLLEVLSQIELVAPTDSTVLILGETGTGKELAARAIHDRSARKERPLVKVNCGAISAGLVESELFGHVKGAFTGALASRDGRFKIADGGTLFLDEVGELPLETQVKLLRVLQEREFEPIGSSKSIQVDVRIIAATNRNLETAVREGKFRADLLYRLNVLPLHLPALRERQEDIPLFVMFFLQKFSRQFGKQIASVSDSAMRRLVGYSWPGNIRELQNVIERAVVLCQGPVLNLPADFQPAFENSLSQTQSVRVPRPARLAEADAVSDETGGSLDDVQRRHITSVLAKVNWVIEGEHGAARLLNLSPSTLRSRMQKLNIARPRAGA